MRCLCVCVAHAYLRTCLHSFQLCKCVCECVFGTDRNAWILNIYQHMHHTVLCCCQWSGGMFGNSCNLHPGVECVVCCSTNGYLVLSSTPVSLDASPLHWNGIVDTSTHDLNVLNPPLLSTPRKGMDWMSLRITR